MCTSSSEQKPSVGRTLHGYVMLLHCGGMHKSGHVLTHHLAVTSGERIRADSYVFQVLKMTVYSVSGLLPRHDAAVWYVQSACAGC
jgi:hypothetical protein